MIEKRKPGPRRPLAVRKYIVSVYITQGYAAAKPIAIQHGYRPRYICHLARDILGHGRTIRSQLVQCVAYKFDPRFVAVKVSA